ncbi:hypothetical protein [Photobacterium carnosum]|uniref:hypothetical protein n=1 Tax=Photobacterium carnosum TaxID=2023717 RepID=UPI001E5B0658|nr:hypothetical protein [Photobacterium carnosum]
MVHADEKSLEQTRLKSDSQQLIRDVLSSKKQVNVINLIGSSQQTKDSILVIEHAHKLDIKDTQALIEQAQSHPT